MTVCVCSYCRVFSKPLGYVFTVFNRRQWHATAGRRTNSQTWPGQTGRRLTNEMLDRHFYVHESAHARAFHSKCDASMRIAVGTFTFHVVAIFHLMLMAFSVDVR